MRESLQSIPCRSCPQSEPREMCARDVRGPQRERASLPDETFALAAQGGSEVLLPVQTGFRWLRRTTYIDFRRSSFGCFEILKRVSRASHPIEKGALPWT